MSGAFYDTDQAVAEYLLFHYGKPSETLPYSFGPRDALEFPRRCVEFFRSCHSFSTADRALDLGCAVGGASFELARHCASVVGVDFSAKFVNAAEHLARNGSLTYSFVEEGDLRRPATAEIAADIDRSRLRFEVGDAENLREDLGVFDVVLAANLIDRLRAPRAFLDRLPSLVKKGGAALITSPYTWLETFTPRENWLQEAGGGRSGKSSFECLKDAMSRAFEPIGREDLPFLIREHARKHQWSVADASVWRKL